MGLRCGVCGVGVDSGVCPRETRMKPDFFGFVDNVPMGISISFVFLWCISYGGMWFHWYARLATDCETLKHFPHCPQCPQPRKLVATNIWPHGHWPQPNVSEHSLRLAKLVSTHFA